MKHYLFLFFTLLLIVESEECPPSYEPFGYDGKCFKLVTEKKSFSDASAFCKSENAYLISIDNSFENQQLYTATASQQGNSVWIGLIGAGNGKYIWDDGRSVYFSNWKSGYPLDSQFCAWMKSDKGFTASKWQNGGNCSEEKIFACQTIPSEKMECMDILFILERSQPIWPDDYNKLVKNIVKESGKRILFEPKDPNYPQKYSRVGVIQYDYKAVMNINLSKRTESEFQQLVDLWVNFTRPDGSSNGHANAHEALQLAYDVFSDKNVMKGREYQNTVIINISHGKHSIVTADPIPVAEEIRSKFNSLIICVGLNGTNGDYRPAEKEELLRINGNQLNRMFDATVPNLMQSIVQEVMKNIDCSITSKAIRQQKPGMLHRTPKQ